MINEQGIFGYRWSPKTIFLLLLSPCWVASGCQRTQTIWSGEARSPDGKVVATARASANGGFGVSGAPATFVYLNWTTGFHSPTQVLILDDQSDRADEALVGMTWLAPNRLELTYNAKRQNISFQAGKFDGVDISVRDTSSATSNSNTRSQ